jgi:hypothetical protein
MSSSSSQPLLAPSTIQLLETGGQACTVVVVVVVAATPVLAHAYRWATGTMLLETTFLVLLDLVVSLTLRLLRRVTKDQFISQPYN